MINGYWVYTQLLGLGPDIPKIWVFTKLDTKRKNGIQPICRPIIKMVLGNKVTFSLNLFKNDGIFGEISLNPLGSKLNMSFVGIVQIS